jgi:hypothetical protein
LGHFHEYPATAGYFFTSLGPKGPFMLGTHVCISRGYSDEVRGTWTRQYEYMDKERSDECMDETIRVHGQGTK